MLTVTGIANLTDGFSDTAPDNRGSRSSIVNVGVAGASSPLQEGDTVRLIDASSAGAQLVANSDLNTTATGAGMHGVTLKYEFGIEAANNLLTANRDQGWRKRPEQGLFRRLSLRRGPGQPRRGPRGRAGHARSGERGPFRL
jgi:hypothetical protein